MTMQFLCYSGCFSPFSTLSEIGIASRGSLSAPGYARNGERMFSLRYWGLILKLSVLAYLLHDKEKKHEII